METFCLQQYWLYNFHINLCSKHRQLSSLCSCAMMSVSEQLHHLEDISVRHCLMDVQWRPWSIDLGFGDESACESLCLCVNLATEILFIQYICRKWRHKCISFHGGAKARPRPAMLKRDAIGRKGSIVTGSSNHSNRGGVCVASLALLSFLCSHV